MPTKKAKIYKFIKYAKNTLYSLSKNMKEYNECKNQSVPMFNLSELRSGKTSQIDTIQVKLIKIEDKSNDCHSPYTGSH